MLSQTVTLHVLCYSSHYGLMDVCSAVASQMRLADLAKGTAPLPFHATCFVHICYNMLAMADLEILEMLLSSAPVVVKWVSVLSLLQSGFQPVYSPSEGPYLLQALSCSWVLQVSSRTFASIRHAHMCA